MKKIIGSLLLAAVLILNFAACNKNDDPVTTGDVDNTHEGLLTGELLVADGDGINTFANPIIEGGTKVAVGNDVGDPYVMRWNGTYYMYASTPGSSNQVRCWTSTDLVNWVYAGACAEDNILFDAYAPEVVYYNGYFYMYTSPGGNGHYVLKSKSPTGPFEIITNNWGHSIDGDVFIDNDGTWYFYSAGGTDGGIKYYTMTSPSKISENGKTVGSYMDGWTEGPMIIYYDGSYFMTYTGNHVNDDGYRINYSVGLSTPTAFAAGANNPILVNSDPEEIHAPGHSSSVLSPTLDSYYIVYHTHGETGRQTCIGRIVINGKEMSVLGNVTQTAQQSPQLPDIRNTFTSASNVDDWTITGGSIDRNLVLSDGGTVLSNISFGDGYSAEFNIMNISGTSAGALFSYTDENNYGKALFDPASQKLVVTFVINGVETTYRKELAKSFDSDVDFSALQAIMVYKSGKEFTFFVNGRELVRYESDLGGGKIGAISVGGKATIGCITGSGDVWQSSLDTYYKPITGDIEAITCANENVNITTIQKVNYVSASAGEILNYYVNVDGLSEYYDLNVKYRSTEDAVIEIYQNDVLVGTMTLSPTSGKTYSAILRGIKLESGMSGLSIKVVSGTVVLKTLSFTECTLLSDVDYEFDGSLTVFNLNGNGRELDGNLSMLRNNGKYLIGDDGWGDYTIETALSVTGTNGAIDIGVLFRASNPSDGIETHCYQQGIYFVQGYYVGLTDDGVVLAKMNYDFTELKTYSMSVSKNTTYTVKIQAIGRDIKVWLDGNLIIEYTDREDPFVSGMVGFRWFQSNGTAEYINIKAE